jgi:hypothetical protein
MYYRAPVTLTKDDWEPLWYLTPAGEAVKVMGTFAITRVDATHPYHTYSWCRVSQRSIPTNATWLKPNTRVFLSDKRLYSRDPKERTYHG